MFDSLTFPLMTSCFQFSASFQYSSVFFSFWRLDKHHLPYCYSSLGLYDGVFLWTRQLSALSRWCWCSRVQGPSQFKTWCSVCMTELTPSHITPLTCPALRGWRGRKFKVPHTLQTTQSQGPQMRRRARSQGCLPSRGWFSLTAHGTRPTRSAQTRDCKVIMKDCICADFQRAVTAGDY